MQAVNGLPKLKCRYAAWPPPKNDAAAAVTNRRAPQAPPL